MAKQINWAQRLRPGVRGVAVEGTTDIPMLTAFLNAGEASGLWTSWATRLQFEAVDKNQHVIENVQQASNENLDVWGLIDRDWQTDIEVAEREANTARLRVLPRVMIENYLIAPSDVFEFLPPSKRTQTVKTQLDAGLSGSIVDDWLRNGALWAVVHENNAGEFCRERGSGYPSRALAKPEHDDVIQALLQGWYAQLEPEQIMIKYHQKQAAFRALPPVNWYARGIYGKSFFAQIVVPLLNRLFGQRSEGQWRSELYIEQPPAQCPSDIQPILLELLDF